MQVARLTHDIKENYEKHNVTSLVLLDIEKAFDTMWIDGLVYKLITNKFPTHLIKLINNYLRDRTIQIKINNTLSKKKKLTAGVPQGSVLGPGLFAHFINDIPKFAKTKMAIYADDTAVYAHSFNAQVATKQTQIHIDEVCGYARDWKIKINENKTEHIIFKKKFTNIKVHTPLTLNQNKIQQKMTVKYLGVQLDHRLNYKRQVDAALQKGNIALRDMYPLLNAKSKMTMQNKRLLYTAIIRPIITYAAPVWCTTAKTNMNKLQRLQNKIIRLVLNKDRYTSIKELHAQSGLPMIKEYITNMTKTFYNKQTRHNELTKNIKSPL